VGPEHSYFADAGIAEYAAVDDRQALTAFEALSRSEGIIPALETSHAIYYAMQLAPTMPIEQVIVINLSGRGDKDVSEVMQLTGGRS
jgi:tryptophan synthase beta chain